jgi:ribosomal protein L10
LGRRFRTLVRAHEEEKSEETMARPDKAAAVAELSERFTSSSGAVLTEYRGLTVKALKELRRSLGEDATYAVSKNTLTAIAAKQAGVEGIDDLLVGDRLHRRRSRRGGQGPA